MILIHFILKLAAVAGQYYDFLIFILKLAGLADFMCVLY